MNPSDDQLDNLLRDHLAGELDPMRGQARRAFAREVTAPMKHRLRQRAWQEARRRIIHAAPLAMSMAACAALGFYVPRFMSAPSTPGQAVAVDKPTPVPTQLAELDRTMIKHEEQSAGALPDGSPGRRIVANQVESASWIDPQTHARTDVYVFPNEQEIIQSTGRQ